MHISTVAATLLLSFDISCASHVLAFRSKLNLYSSNTHNFVFYLPTLDGPSSAAKLHRNNGPSQRTTPHTPVTVDGCSPVHPGQGKTHDGPTILGRTILNVSRQGASEQAREPSTPRPSASFCSPVSRSVLLPAPMPPPSTSQSQSFSAADFSSFRLCARSALESRCSPRALVKVYVFG